MKKITLALICVCLIYFSCLIFISYKHIAPGVFFGALLKACAMPFIILLLILLIFSLIKMYLEKWSIKLEYFLSALISSATIALLIAATIFT